MIRDTSSKTHRGIPEQEQEGQEKLTRDVTERSPDEGYDDQLSNPHESGNSGRLGKPRKAASSKLRTTLTGGRAVTCQGRSLRINIPVTTPTRTITAIRELLFDDMLKQSRRSGSNGGKCAKKLSINKNKVHQAEKMIMGALIELYKGLGLGVSQDIPVTAKEAQSIYLKVVESSYFNVSDMVIRLMDDVDELFVRHFAEGDKRKAMKYLKPNQREESHTTTFFIALFIGYCIMAHIAGMYTQQSNKVYMATSYPVLSMVSLFFLHLFLYGCNIFMWRKTCINYTFIFEFTHAKELKYCDVFLICTMVFLLILVCLFNIVYRSCRYHFLRVIRNIILTPFYKVVMVDFFMPDQLCSQGARKWFDEGDINHIVNIGKYVSAMLAAGTKGFNSKNPWFRNDLILKLKYIYFLSMGLNLVLRLAWLQTVIHPNIGSLDSIVTLFFLAALEVIRRGHWKFYRLENEHLNNTGKFRAVKVVPLPFHEVEED
ncbi:hypothetical protein ABZP36_012801 [Zizania latifolia]